MKKDNSILLRNWLLRTLVDNPDLIHKGAIPTEMYLELQEIWLKEVQDAMKYIIKKLKLKA